MSDSDYCRCGHTLGWHDSTALAGGCAKCRCGLFTSLPAPVPGVPRNETRDEAWWRKTFDEYQANSEALIDDLRRQLLTLQRGVSSRVEPTKGKLYWPTDPSYPCPTCGHIPAGEPSEPVTDAEIANAKVTLRRYGHDVIGLEIRDVLERFVRSRSGLPHKTGETR